MHPNHIFFSQEKKGEGLCDVQFSIFFYISGEKMIYFTHFYEDEWKIKQMILCELHDKIRYPFDKKAGFEKKKLSIAKKQL